MKTQKNTAFTLVELIIVITILAILATIGFMSYQSYTLDARDGKRKADLGELRTGLEVYQAKNAKLIDPDNFATIYTGALIFSYQGYAGNSVLAKLRAGDSFIDTTDKKYYTYSIDPNKTKYQLLAMLENNPNNTAYNDLVKQTYALDYTNRYSYTLGNNFGIVLSGSTKIPVQEGNSGSNVTITDNPTNYNIVVNNESQETNTITNFASSCTIAGQIISSSSKYTGCDTNDIIICSGTSTGYIIAACNVGASIAGTGVNNNSVGKFFQWGENFAWDFDGGVISSDNCIWNNLTQNCGVSGISSWPSSVTDSIGGGAERWLEYGSIQGPCATGYHVPKLTDWGLIISAGGWGNNRLNMSNTLKMPVSGFRYTTNGALTKQNIQAGFWSTTPDPDPGARHMYFDTSSSIISATSQNARANAFSIRCIKD